ncbi:hypothetical protein PQX77_012141 [Marasmius sp. AFHP31]|nr:hypothetical protein PQX77_012141 [Marasmius sp. AFHP31]
MPNITLSPTQPSPPRSKSKKRRAPAAVGTNARVDNQPREPQPRSKPAKVRAPAAVGTNARVDQPQGSRPQAPRTQEEEDDDDDSSEEEEEEEEEKPENSRFIHARMVLQGLLGDEREPENLKNANLNHRRCNYENPLDKTQFAGQEFHHQDAYKAADPVIHAAKYYKRAIDAFVCISEVLTVGLIEDGLIEGDLVAQGIEFRGQVSLYRKLLSYSPHLKELIWVVYHAGDAHLYSWAYVDEWYTKPTMTPNQRDLHGHHSVAKAYATDGVTPEWSIIPVCNIRQTCMLAPNFLKSPMGDDWTHLNVLDKADHFFVKHLQSVARYKTF